MRMGVVLMSYCLRDTEWSSGLRTLEAASRSGGLGIVSRSPVLPHVMARRAPIGGSLMIIAWFGLALAFGLEQRAAAP